MSVHVFYLYQVGWYLFGTAAAFAAALLFWQKGRAIVSAPDVGSGFGLRLGGAAGIFVAVLLVIHYIDPLKPLSDYSKILLVYSTADPRAGDPPARTFSVQPSTFGSELIGEHVVVELISAKEVYSLAPRLEDNAFATSEPVPVGTYWLSLVNTETGSIKRFIVDVPSS